jgi:hypothetical protein
MFNDLELFFLLSNIFTILIYSMATYFQYSSFALGCLVKINKFLKMRFEFLKSSRCLATDARKIFLYGNSQLKQTVIRNHFRDPWNILTCDFTYRLFQVKCRKKGLFPTRPSSISLKIGIVRAFSKK